MALTSADLARLGPQAQKQVLDKLAGTQKPKKSKYGNRFTPRVMPNGKVHEFKSAKEARRYDELALMERMTMKLVTAADVWYTQQQKTLDEIAEKLGVVAYRPSYHGAERDKNTVLFYLKEDEEHNREVDRQPVRYSRSEAKDRGVNVNSECVYRDHFWSFENSDANGQLDMGWANNGKLNLRSLDWKTKLEGSITFAFARKMQFNYVRSTGGYLELREADHTYNDWNREQLRALKMMHGRLFLGSINFHGDQRKKVVAGKEGIYEELLDQMVYNFGCDFAIPVPDKELEELIRAWNGDERLPKKLVDVEAMTGRVERLGGINLIWY